MHVHRSLLSVNKCKHHTDNVMMLKQKVESEVMIYRAPTKCGAAGADTTVSVRVMHGFA
mgnify:CR=1 FL=1